LLFVLFALLASGYVLLQHKGIQNRLTTYFMSLISENLNTKCTIGEVDLAFPYRLRLKNIYIEDQNQDTLLFSRSLTIGVSRINPVKKVIKVNAINLNEAYFRLSSDSANLLNIEFILQRIRGNSAKSGSGWSVALNNIKLKQSRFRLQIYPYKKDDSGINFSDMQLYDLDLVLQRFVPGKDSTSFNIKSLSFTELSGFRVDDFKADFSLGQTFMRFMDLSVKTPVSELHGEGVQLLFNNYKDFAQGNFFEKVKLSVDLKNSSLNLSDLGFFSPVFKGADQIIVFTGRSRGPVGNLKVKDIDIRFGNTSLIQGKLDINGLPDTKEVFIFADFKEFRTSGEDIENFRLPGRKKLTLPERLDKLGTILYKGKFTGFLNDFVAFGKFKTDLGELSSDVLFKPDTSNYFNITGRISAVDFDLGTFLDMRKNIGHITMSVTANGYISENDLKTELKGEVTSFEIKGYQYKNIQLSGTILNKTYNGALYINDPNINLDFHGKVDFSKETGSYNFVANVTQANMYALNVDKSDPGFDVSFYIEANATGHNLSDLNGEVRLLNSLFEKKDKQLQVYDFLVKSVSQSSQQSLQIHSDFLEAELKGAYDLTKVVPFFKKILSSYLPSLVDTTHLSDYTFNNSFELSLLFKNTKPIFEFFLPDYYIDATSTLNVFFNSQTRALSLFCNAPMVKIKNLTWNDYHLNLKGDTTELDLEAGGQNLIINDKIELDNFTVLSKASNDSAGFLARWNNWEDVAYRGSLNANLLFSKPAGTSHPQMAIHILPTFVITNDTTWNINQCQIIIDSNHIVVDDFSVHHNNELVSLNGRISSDPSDKIDLRFSGFNLGNLNVATNSKGFKLEGMLNGNASFSGIYNSPVIVSNLVIDSLILNNEKLGTANIMSSWNNRKKSLEIEANAMRDKLKTLSVEGHYYVNTKGLDFDITLDKLRLNPFNPYLAKLVNNLKGMATGNLTLNGTLEKPVLNGEVNMQKAAFTVNYLQTRYNFSEKIRMVNNKIFFNDLRVFDGYGNKALVNGNINYKNLRDLSFDISIKAEEMQFLNTRSTDNKMFYGTAFATGLVTINGSPSNVNMEISARTEKNTVFKIPLTTEEELTQYNFIKMVHDNADEQSHETVLRNEYKVDLSGFHMNFDLEVTPDAEVQIIFDPKVGDILKGSGSGNLNMKISTSGNFIMYGDFTIDKGDYLLTVQNVFNKKFTIEPGGTIRWNGDPFDATIDLLAKYRTKASLSELLGTEQTNLKEKIPVDCQLFLTGKLMTPTVRFDIDLPQSEEETKLVVKNKINTTEEIDKQVISLLMLNSFYYNPGSTGTMTSAIAATPYSNAAGTTVSELLSNQLSNWLSQISNDFDIGINYRNDARQKNDEVEVMLGTQLFNDRLSINGSVDVATNATANASKNIVGEFDIDYKLTKSGRFRVKTYNHINNDLLIESSPYTQGLGFTYKEEFNTLGELVRRYWRSIVGKKEENDVLSGDEGKKGH